MKKIRASFNSIVSILFLSALLIYFFNNPTVFDEILSVPVYAVIGMATLKTLRIFINGLFTKFTLKAFDKHITYGETNYLSLITTLGNFFGPILGGASVRAIYLKSKHKFQYSKFASTLYGYYVIAFLTNSLIGTIVLLNISKVGTEESAPALLLLLSVLTMTSMLLLLPTIFMQKILKKIKFIPKKLAGYLLTAASSWDTIKNDKLLITKLFFLNLTILTIATADSYILYSLFVEDFELGNVILYAVLGTLSVLISFTPGAIGVKEGIYLFTSSVLLLSPETILQMATLDRSITFVLLFVMYGIVKILRIDRRLLPDNPEIKA